MANYRASNLHFFQYIQYPSVIFACLLPPPPPPPKKKAAETGKKVYEGANLESLNLVVSQKNKDGGRNREKSYKGANLESLNLVVSLDTEVISRRDFKLQVNTSTPGENTSQIPGLSKSPWFSYDVLTF